MLARETTSDNGPAPRLSKSLPPNTVPPNTVLALAMPDLLARISVSKPYVYKMMRQGRFPKPIKVGHKALWMSDEIDAWIEVQRARRDATTA
jgi:prophage regulatory protein